MTEVKQLTPEQHRLQINAYSKAYPSYKTYADALRRVLEKACRSAVPQAVVQTRPKNISSFAEKVIRKYPKYTDAVNQLTDLCGGRVIVQTMEQVRSVRQFIEANFLIVEKDDKGTLLGQEKFGYRDMHYIVQLLPDRAEALGFTSEECAKIGDHKAEIQVRTWLQHAWADTLHDRIYKNPLKLSAEIKRTGNLLAALMEEGDRNFNSIADELDGMIANYASYTTKEKVLREIHALELILDNEPNEEKKPALALGLAKLFSASGDYGKMVELLSPYGDTQGAIRCELIQELGNALCSKYDDNPQSSDHERGRDLLKESIAICCDPICSYAPDLRKKISLHGRALARLARSLENLPECQHDACEYWHQAHEHEPENPYYLGGMLLYEVNLSHQIDMAAAMRTTLRQAITTCRSHAENGTELPFAYLTAGRLSIMLGEPYKALGYYARAIQYIRVGIHCCPPDLLEREVHAISRLLILKHAPEGLQQVLDMIKMARGIPVAGYLKPELFPKAVFIVGGSDGCTNETLALAQPLLEAILSRYEGVVISGGTKSGIPGAVGDICGSLRVDNRKSFALIGYIPHHLPADAPKHEEYDQHIQCGGDSFSPEQVFQSWRDLLDKGIHPHEVICIGFGGGKISGFEYSLALALGAGVFITQNSGGSADELVEDPLWEGVPNLYPIPADEASFKAVLSPPHSMLTDDALLEMAQELHSRYVEDSVDSLPENMQPWAMLKDTYKEANIEQVKYAVEILRAGGFDVRQAEGSPIEFSFDGFEEEVETMAELEHGRWNVERLRAGWRPGSRRDNELQMNPSIIPWKELSDDIKAYDRDAVLVFPKILAKAGLEIFRV